MEVGNLIVKFNKAFSETTYQRKFISCLWLWSDGSIWWLWVMINFKWIKKISCFSVGRVIAASGRLGFSSSSINEKWSLIWRGGS